ncbi:MAG: TatD family hydrolase [Xanthomonadaceae bacterium]|nr:TatD family hydrolase [Xanthomonadaceae bacterium]
MIDLHCHLDLYPDPAAVIARCVERKTYVLSITTVPKAYRHTHRLALGAGRIRTALGLHPQLAATRTSEMGLFEELLPSTSFVGEIGLDGSYEHRSTLSVQRAVFQDIMDLCGRAGGKTISIHSRAAVNEVLQTIAPYASSCRLVLHWFVGTPRQVARAAEMGCWFSVGPAMLTSARGRASVAAMPPSRILPESDGPFGSLDGEALNPWDAWLMVAQLADLWNKQEDEVGRAMFQNFRSLLTFDTAA